MLAVNRVWEAYGSRLAQLHDPDWGPALLAASEVIWSARQRAAALAPAAAVAFPPPIPFIDSIWSPAAFPSEIFPEDAVSPAPMPSAVRKTLERLPVPMVRLPPAILDEPWLYATLGHEMGHVLHHDLRPDLDLTTLSGTVIEERVAQLAPGSKEQQERWFFCNEELVADLFSVLLLGRAALLAMMNLDIGPPDDPFWTKFRDAGTRRYPPRAARLVLLSRWGGAADPAADLVTRLGERGDPTLGPILAEAAADPLTTQLGQALADPWVTGAGAPRRLSDLVGAAPVGLGKGHTLMTATALKVLSEAPDVVAAAKGQIAPSDTAALEMAAGFVWTGQDVRENGGPAQEERAERLRRNAAAMLRACRTSGTRAGAPKAAPDLTDVAELFGTASVATLGAGVEEAVG